MPDYMRISKEKVDPQHVWHQGGIGVISKSNGWLTVDAKNKSRVAAYENQKFKLVNRETSPLSPLWMQNVNHLKADLQKVGELQKKSLDNTFARGSHIEHNRAILFDTKQPLRSGNHMETTASIFKTNDKVGDRRAQ